MNSRGVELATIERHVLVGMGKRPLQALQLQGVDLVARRVLDRVQNVL